MKKKTVAMFLMAALALSLGWLPGDQTANADVIAGNDVIDRYSGPDSWTDFYLMDRNNGFSDDSIMTGFEVFVDRLSPFEFIVYAPTSDNAIWEVVYNSGEITPEELGIYTAAIDPVCIPAGSYVGLYYPNIGAVPFTVTGVHYIPSTLALVVLFTNNNTEEDGSEVGYEVQFLNSGDRVYSIEALGFSVADWDLTYTGELLVPTNNVTLEATLTGTGNEGIDIDFYIDGSLVGSATTDADGVATLTIGPHASGIYDVTAKAYCFEATDTLVVYEARITGGGQIIAENEHQDNEQKNGKFKDYKISFGMGAYRIIYGMYLLDSCEVTFHNVSNNEIDKYKFVGTTIIQMIFAGDGGSVARYDVSGYLEDDGSIVDGSCSMIIRVQDSGEPAWEDNIRFELFADFPYSYDSSDADPYTAGFQEPADFPDYLGGASGQQRTLTAHGNLQVEDLTK